MKNKMNTMKTLRISNLKLLLLPMLTLFALMSISQPKQKPMVIQEQGSFAVGGTVITNPGTFNPASPTPDGQTFHGDHAYVFYQIPAKAR